MNNREKIRKTFETRLKAADTLEDKIHISMDIFISDLINKYKDQNESILEIYKCLVYSFLQCLIKACAMLRLSPKDFEEIVAKIPEAYEEQQIEIEKFVTAMELMNMVMPINDEEEEEK